MGLTKDIISPDRVVPLQLERRDSSVLAGGVCWRCDGTCCGSIHGDCGPPGHGGSGTMWQRELSGAKKGKTSPFAPTKPTSTLQPPSSFNFPWAIRHPSFAPSSDNVPAISIRRAFSPVAPLLSFQQAYLPPQQQQSPSSHLLRGHWLETIACHRLQRWKRRNATALHWAQVQSSSFQGNT